MDSPTSPTQNSSSVHADSIISSLLSFPDSSPLSIASSFRRELEQALASASDDASVQERLVDRTLQLVSLLLESTKRSFRKRATAHNSSAWFLPPELTVKVFSMVDTKSLMRAAACCTMFNTCAMDRFAYAHVDLTTATSQVDSKVVCNLIHRAGKELRNRLKSLGLYNIRSMNSSFEVLSVCSNLTDLRIVGLNNPFMHLFKILTEKCRLIEYLFIETYQLPSTIIDTVKGSHLIKFVTNSPNLTSLRLIRFRLTDEVARILAQSSRTLEYLNLSRSPTINGRFLRDVRNRCKESPLKTLIVRNCLKLQEKEVLELCNSLIKGNFKSIRHIDVSNKRGLVSDDGKRSYKPKFPLQKLKEERSDVTLVAEFPSLWSVKDCPVCHEEDDEELREIEMMEDDASSSDASSSDDESSDASSSDDESSEDDLG
ncbi:BnaA03g57270D [Brassica napus]|uniref:BnaA03g57270D protein n=1 Tax=Brassica napus TaxID=3708 RepID=A0A078JLQ1_BRANA|nr:BnaA03g57270D [Brassica napus]